MSKQILWAIGLIVTLNITVHGQQVGNEGPDFEINLIGGDQFKLSDHRGTVVLVYLFGNSCPYCIASGPAIESSLHKTFSDNPNFTAVGLDTWDGSSSVASVTSFKNKTGITFPLAVKAGHVLTDYQTTYDRLMVIDQHGILVHKGVVPAGNDISNAESAIMTSLASIEEDPCDTTVIHIDETIHNPQCSSDSNGSIEIEISGGMAPYEITWFNDSHTDSIGGLSEGCYNVVVTDANGCNEQADFCISVPEPLVVDLMKTDNTCLGDSSGTISIEVSGGTPPYQKLWNDQELQSVVENLIPGDYTISVIDANGCQEVDSITIAEPEDILLDEITGSVDVEALNSYTYSVAEVNNVTYTWNIDGGSIISGQGTHQIEVQWGSDTAGVLETIAETGSGCLSNTSSIDVTIMTLTGEEENPENSVVIYPNPVGDLLFVSTDNEMVVFIYDITGILQMTTREKRIDLTSFKNGIYIVKVKFNNFIMTKRVLRQ